MASERMSGSLLLNDGDGDTLHGEVGMGILVSMTRYFRGGALPPHGLPSKLLKVPDPTRCREESLERLEGSRSDIRAVREASPAGTEMKRRPPERTFSHRCATAVASPFPERGSP